MNNSVDFSDKITCNSTVQPQLSPNNTYIAYSAQQRTLMVRDIENLTVVAVFTCLDTINAISWSPNSQQLLCLLKSRGVVQVFSISDPEFNCTISEGLTELAAAQWTSTGQHIVITAEFSISCHVWNLSDKSCIEIQPPKSGEALKFSPDGALLATIERINCKDSVSIYKATPSSTWQPIAHFSLPTHDAANLAWCPDSSCLAIWDAAVYGHNILIVSPKGELITNKQDYTDALGVKTVQWSPSGHLLAVGTYERDVDVLNSGNWESLVSFVFPDKVTGPEDVLVYSEVQEEKTLSAAVDGLNNDDDGNEEKKTAVLQDTDANSQQRVAQKAPSSSRSRSTSPEKKPTDTTAAATNKNNNANTRRPAWGGGGGGGPAASSLARSRSTSPMKRPFRNNTELIPPSVLRARYIIAALPVEIQPQQQQQNDKTTTTTAAAGQISIDLKLGVSLAAWSPDGVYLAARNDAAPHTVWIWDVTKLQLAAVLMQAQPVLHFAWSPCSNSNGSTDTNKLAIVSGAGRVYMWCPDGASCVHMPSEMKGMKVTELQWSSDGSVLVLSSKAAGYYCCAYFS